MEKNNVRITLRGKPENESCLTSGQLSCTLDAGYGKVLEGIDFKDLETKFLSLEIEEGTQKRLFCLGKHAYGDSKVLVFCSVEDLKQWDKKGPQPPYYVYHYADDAFYKESKKVANNKLSMKKYLPVTKLQKTAYHHLAKDMSIVERNGLKPYSDDMEFLANYVDEKKPTRLPVEELTVRLQGKGKEEGNSCLLHAVTNVLSLLGSTGHENIQNRREVFDTLIPPGAQETDGMIRVALIDEFVREIREKWREGKEEIRSSSQKRGLHSFHMMGGLYNIFNRYHMLEQMKTAKLGAVVITPSAPPIKVKESDSTSQGEVSIRRSHKLTPDHAVGIWYDKDTGSFRLLDSLPLLDGEEDPKRGIKYKISPESLVQLFKESNGVMAIKKTSREDFFGKR